ncbi:Hypoxia induced protein, domain containing protein [Rhabdaerophilaceae bacterium]
MGIIMNVSIAAVAVVLVLGLVNMLRAGSPNRSQMLMRWRIGLQFFAILAIMAYVLIRGG